MMTTDQQSIQTAPFTLEIRGLSGPSDSYKIHRALLREIYMADFKPDFQKKTLTLLIQDQDRERVLDLIDALGFEPKIVHRFTTGIEGIF
jgi:hypothetical protein